jgi:outer membrane protein OmpA-like peptidoglycan-associated protein
MVPYETFRSNAYEAPAMRRWIFIGLVASLLIHAGLVIFFYRKELQNFGLQPEQQLAPPRAFTVQQVTIPQLEQAGEPQVKPAEDKPTAQAKVEIPVDRPIVQDEVVLAPQMPALPKRLLNEKPKVEAAGLEQLAKADAGAREAMDKELTAITQGILKESPSSPRQPLLPVAGGNKVGSGEGEFNVNIPGLKSLDEALAATGPLPAGDKPIGMPGGALFEYNSYDLLPAAISELKKLGTLIQRNPNATFSIEGHTDSFGSADYNQMLSEKRAESVKIWLVEMMKIPEERIHTRGFGNSKWLVSPDKSKEEQAPNRRVEIVVKTNRR